MVHWLAMRWRILALLVVSLMVNLVDRQVLSLVAPLMRDELSISNTGYGVIVAAFLLGMTLFQIPVGLALDRFGARAGLALLVSLWSFITGLHCWARSTMHFGVLRFLLGMAECGNYSAGVKVIGQWFPPHQRALAGGIFNSGSIAGSMLAPPLVVWLTMRFGWRNAFLLAASVGALWIIPWLMGYRRPEQIGPAIGSGERTALRVHFHSRAVWTVLLMRALGGPVNHFYWYWLPEYLKRERGLSLEMIGVLAWLPYLFAGIGNVLGGWASGRLLARGWQLDAARKLVFCGGTACCLASMLVPLAPGAGSAIALIGLASFGIAAYAANLIGLITDLFPQRMLAQVTGIAGAGEGIIAMCTVLLTGVVVDRYSYLPVFLGAGILPVLGVGAFFLLLRPSLSSKPGQLS